MMDTSWSQSQPEASTSGVQSQAGAHTHHATMPHHHSRAANACQSGDWGLMRGRAPEPHISRPACDMTNQRSELLLAPALSRCFGVHHFISLSCPYPLKPAQHSFGWCQLSSKWLPDSLDLLPGICCPQTPKTTLHPEAGKHVPHTDTWGPPPLPSQRQKLRRVMSPKRFNNIFLDACEQEDDKSSAFRPLPVAEIYSCARPGTTQAVCSVIEKRQAHSRRLLQLFAPSAHYHAGASCYDSFDSSLRVFVLLM